MATPKRQEEYRESITKRAPSDNRRNRQRVIRSSDRSNLAYQPDSTRNAHSTMPGAPKSPDFKSSIPDTASNFKESYDKAGLQPANLDERPTPSRAKEGDIANRSAQVQYRTNQPMVKPGSRTYKKRVKVRRKNKAKSALAKARVTTANITILAWGMWIWMWFQLPMAILSTGLMAIAQALHEVYKTFTLQAVEGGDESGWFSGLLSGMADTIFKGVNYISIWVLGIDLTIFSPGNLYLITVIILMTIGGVTLLLTYMTYKMAFLRPLSGQKAGLKWTMFMVVTIGYMVGSMVPLANMVPWFLFWTVVVWLYPK